MEIECYRASDLPQMYWERWSAVQSANPAVASPQFRPEWIQIVADHHQHVEVGVVLQTGEAVAFFPFERTGRRTAGPVGGILTDIHGMIAVPGTQVDWRQLLSGCRLHAWRFDHLPIDQSWLRPCQLETDPAPIIDLAQGYATYQNEQLSVHRDWYKQLERKERKLTRDLGPVRFDKHTVADGSLRSLLTWKSQQLLAAGLHNPYDNVPIQAILSAVARCSEPGFSGLLSTLCAGDRLLAVMLSQKSGKVINAWIPAYDPDYARYSPGAILHQHLIRAAAGEGVLRIELGRGINPLKQTLSSSDILLAIGNADTRRIKGTLSNFAYRVKSRMRRSPAVINSLRLFRRLRIRMHSK